MGKGRGSSASWSVHTPVRERLMPCKVGSSALSLLELRAPLVTMDGQGETATPWAPCTHAVAQQLPTIEDSVDRQRSAPTGLGSDRPRLASRGDLPGG